MTPNKIQYFLAHGIKIAIIGGGLVLGTVVAMSCGAFSFWAVLATLAALPLGALFGMFIFLPLIQIICRFLNGAPFHTGDMVHILVGPHRDCVVRVYVVWASRGQVRVALGEQEEHDVKDVFLNIEVCREWNA
jgi:hypothetical protein